MVLIADAKEVGVENPAEETFRNPNLTRHYADQVRCQSHLKQRISCGRMYGFASAVKVVLAASPPP